MNIQTSHGNALIATLIGLVGLALVGWAVWLNLGSSETDAHSAARSQTSELMPPKAATKPHTFTHHGITIEDPYAWLKDPSYPEVNDPEILAYLEEENAYFENFMAPHDGLVDTLFEEMKGRQPKADASVPYLKRGYFYQWRFEEGAQYRTWYRAPEDDPEAWQVLLDENELAEGLEYFRLGSLSVSPDTRRLAYSSDVDGSERYRMRVIDLDSRSQIGQPIEATLGSAVWSADSASLYYVRVSEEWRPYQVWHHTLASDEADRLVYEETSGDFFVGIDLTQSEAYVLIGSGGHTSNEVRLVPRDDLNAEPRLIAPRMDAQEYFVEHRGDLLYLRSNKDQPNFDIFTAPIDAPDRSNWTTLIAGDERHYLTDFLVLSDQLVIEERVDGLEQIRIVDQAGESHYVEFPETAYTAGLGVNPTFEADTLRLNYESMVTPDTVFDYDIAARTLTIRKEQEIPSGYDATRFETRRLLAPARDGVLVPVSVVFKRGTPLDGSAPLYVYGYGAYGNAIQPGFSTTRLSLLERGFIYAIAHIRGGDDLGYHWYTQGKLEARENTFNDFVDVARYLIAEGYGSAGNVGIAGGSAGGELMGAVVNQAPELWGAVAAHVPFVDVLNTMLDDSLPLTPLEWPEWGNPITDPAAFELIRSYSPYDQLKPGAYPPMLVTAGLNDPRVTYWEPAKYVAKMRAVKTDDNPLLLKTNMGAGHGGKSGRFDSLREVAEEFAFMLTQLKPEE